MTPLTYFQVVCRILALLLLAPFALCIALDVTAYAIARTLHLSMSHQRVPRSPGSQVIPILTEGEIATFDDGFGVPNGSAAGSKPH
ncbi:hypothetical protein BD324DRAFT_650805 [Kockovaella imperatae]|uniref:Uncharacterized protein n=1 Tax=Kockovaella imperatae TaxID=4999 RepID=A0A1Y1UGV2_9TREE|nr:hypothetical protein BD324DRAFT_650805 [Kockovaella imperatae]ORX37199.1 hypothetical protein BD324DRAFT_650805 [Kockovaella imperatae]